MSSRRRPLVDDDAAAGVAPKSAPAAVLATPAITGPGVTLGFLLGLLVAVAFTWAGPTTLRSAPSAVVAQVVGASVAAPADPLPRRYLSVDESVSRLYTSAGHGPLAVLDLDPAGLAPGTHAFQRLLYEHQHPADCASAKFVVSHGHTPRAGIDAHLHVMSVHLAYALETGRVFTFADDSASGWTDAASCATLSWECFFRAPSGCEKALLTAPGADVVHLHLEKALDGVDRLTMPRVVAPLVEAALPHATADVRRSYYRGQAAAYLMHLNDATIEAVARLRTNATMQRVTGAGPLTRARAATIPLPRGVVHVHVRGGDKGSEMTLQSAAAYASGAERVARINHIPIQRVAYVSSDDSTAIAEFEAAAQGWQVLSYDIPRYKATPVNPISAVIAQAAGEVAGAQALKHLQQFLLALEADAWVGTRASNWNRIIDEARCIWIARCFNYFEEIGDEWWPGYGW
jgi:hypothetical protein